MLACTISCRCSCHVCLLQADLKIGGWKRLFAAATVLKTLSEIFSNVIATVVRHVLECIQCMYTVSNIIVSILYVFL